MLIGIKGTSSLEELLTDVCGRSVSYRPEHEPLQTPELNRSSMRIEVHAKRDSTVLTVQTQEEVEIVNGHEEQICIEQEDTGISHESHVRCHEGILLSTQRLLGQVQKVVEEYVVYGDYKLQIVGHSLGASAGCLLALLLRERYPQLLHGEKLRVHAFAPPPVLDHDSAIAASSYVTSVVNQADLIARCSTANLAVFLEFLRSVSSQVLVPNDLAPQGPQSTARLLRQLQYNEKQLWTFELMEAALKRAQEKVMLRHPDHLYVPGKVVLLEEAKVLSTQTDDHEASVIWNLTDGTNPSLRQLDLSGFRPLGDHTAAAYEATINTLWEQQQV